MLIFVLIILWWVSFVGSDRESSRRVWGSNVCVLVGWCVVYRLSFAYFVSCVPGLSAVSCHAQELLWLLLCALDCFAGFSRFGFCKLHSGEQYTRLSFRHNICDDVPRGDSRLTQVHVVANCQFVFVVLTSVLLLFFPRWCLFPQCPLSGRRHGHVRRR